MCPSDSAIKASGGVSPNGDEKARERSQGIGISLRWNEAFWIQKQRPVKGTVVAFHDVGDYDEKLPACFMVPSLPQLSTDFIDLGRMMDSRQPFFALYLPSELRNADSGSSVQRLAEFYAEEITNSQPEGSIAVGGWSAGGAVALAVAQQLMRLGRHVPLLIVIDGNLPSVVIPPSTSIEAIKLAYFRLISVLGGIVQFTRDLVHQVLHCSPQNPSLQRAIKLAWQHSALRLTLARMIESFRSRTSDRFPPIYSARSHPADTASNISGFPPDHRAFARALYEAIHSYVPETQFPGEVLVYESTSEPARSSASVAKRWARIAAKLAVVPVQGSHMSIVAYPDGTPLVRDLCKRLREASTTQH
jgi:thioesterase domain-containing protein